MTYETRYASTSYLMARYLDQFKNETGWRMRGFVESVKKDCASNASKWKYYRTTTKCLEVIRQNSKEQFQILSDYCEHLKKSNVGSIVVLKTMMAGDVREF
ncbi:hypothetical protein Adt_11680 [Abeliophyllum distichum]|uniref:Uncharacterized protein n=1 Tax=Abeliophyllum distichum TaxID=126358 RepID=A0ABD1UNT9_9LAMI